MFFYNLGGVNSVGEEDSRGLLNCRHANIIGPSALACLNINIIEVKLDSMSSFVRQDSFGLQARDSMSQSLVERSELQSEMFHLLVAEAQWDFPCLTLILAPATELHCSMALIIVRIVAQSNDHVHVR